jgi:hypothetical protein
LGLAEGATSRLRRTDRDRDEAKDDDEDEDEERGVSMERLMIKDVSVAAFTLQGILPGPNVEEETARLLWLRVPCYFLAAPSMSEVTNTSLPMRKPAFSSRLFQVNP